MFWSRGYEGNLYLPLSCVVNLKLIPKKKNHTHSGEAAASAGTKLPATLLFIWAWSSASYPRGPCLTTGPVS